MAHLKSSPNSSEADLIDDLEELSLAHNEAVGDELREMEAEERAAHDASYAELFHRDECAYCASDLGPRDLGRWLVHMSAAHDHEFAKPDLYVVSRSLAFLDDEGRRQLGMLALLGDAAATFAVVMKCYNLKYTKSRASDARSKCTAWTALARVFVEHVPAGLVQFPAGVDPGTTRAGGEAMEALIGLVARDLGFLHYEAFAKNVGVYSSYKFE